MVNSHDTQPIVIPPEVYDKEADLQTPVQASHPNSHEEEGIISVEGGYYPAGRLKAWSTVLGAWLIQFGSVGILTSFGVFQSFYTTTFLSSNSASTISWIGSAQLFLELAGAPIGGKLYDAGHCRAAVLAGSLLFVFSFFMLSLARPNHFYQVFLTQGVGMGIGCSLVFLPTTTVVSQHFKSQRALAMGIVVSSGCLGGVVYSSILNNLIHSRLGFSWSVRAAAFVTLACLAIGNALIFPLPQQPPPATTASSSSLPVPSEESTSPSQATSTTSLLTYSTTLSSASFNEKPLPAPPIPAHPKAFALPKPYKPTTAQSSTNLLPAHKRKPRPKSIISKPPESLKPTAAFWDPAFALLLPGAFFGSLGLYFPLFYLQLFAAQQPGISDNLAFYSVAILNAAGVFGRIIPNFVADRWGKGGALNVFGVCVGVNGVISFAMLGAKTPAGLILFAIFYGFFFSATISVYFPTVISLGSEGVDVGKRVGLALVPVGLAYLVGSPISGLVIGSHFVWWKGIVFASVTMLGSLSFLVAIKVVQSTTSREAKGVS